MAGERRDSDGPRAPADRPLIRRNLSIALGATWLTILLEFLLLRPQARVRPCHRVCFERCRGRFESSQDHPHAVARDGSSSEHLVTMVDSLREAREKLAAQVAEERRIREERVAPATSDSAGRLAAIGVLASGVAHELNNPLQAILGSAELLQVRHDVPPEHKADLAVIKKESARASASSATSPASAVSSRRMRFRCGSARSWTRSWKLANANWLAASSSRFTIRAMPPRSRCSRSCSRWS